MPPSATYSYVANSPLVESIAFTNGSALRMTTTKSYDYLNRLTAISSSSSSSFNYGYNAANQRTVVTNADNSRWNYGYDPLGQVTSGKKYWSDNTLVAGEQFEYTFDDIGNRKTTAAGGDTSGANLRSATYSPNLLNQPTSRTVPAFANIIGEATNAATVTVNNQATARHGDYFRAELRVTNTSPVWLGVTNLAVLNQGTNADIIATNAGNVFIPQTPEAFGYDADGNMTNDGRFMLTWDAENRLVKAESLTNGPAGSKRKVEWTFDALGRRVRQKEFVWNLSTNDYQLSTDAKLVSDGWRHIAELDTTNLTLRTYAWGLDLSGSLDGAGGVGGLLFVTRQSSPVASHAVAYDGNGNVGALMDMADGAESARYEYGPFGELLRATGPMALENPFRFSTKRTSDATDWVLYEYRVYNSSTGRWLSRDPIEEKGGLDIYSFVNNIPLSSVDHLGKDVAVINHGGSTGHTSFVIIFPDGDVIAYHFYAKHYSDWGLSGGVFGVLCCDSVQIWSEYYPKFIGGFGAYMKEQARLGGRVSIKKYAFGTKLDDELATERMNELVKTDPGIYSVPLFKQCHSASREWFYDYADGGRRINPTLLPGQSSSILFWPEEWWETRDKVFNSWPVVPSK